MLSKMVEMLAPARSLCQCDGLCEGIGYCSALSVARQGRAGVLGSVVT
jgi:hypothetical protein